MEQTAPARRVPMVTGGGMQPQAPDIRMLLAKLEEERLARELPLTNPGPPATDSGEDLVLPGNAQQAARPTGPMSADGVRRAMDARSQAEKELAQSRQQSAMRQANDASFKHGVAQSYGEVAAPRDARRVEARTTGINVDPEQVQQDAAAATESAQSFEPKDYKGEYQKAEEASAVAKDLESYRTATAAWEQKRLQLEAQLGSAKEDGDAALAWNLTKQLEAHQRAKPQLSERATGGRTPQELMQPVMETFESLDPKEKEALTSHFLSAAMTQAERQAAGGVVAKDAPLTDRAVDSIIGVYADLPPKERRQVMINDARRIMSAPTVPTVDLQFNPQGFGRGVGDDARAGNAAIPAGNLDDMPPSAKLGSPPVTKRGTRFIQNPDGSSSMRAFSPDQMAPYMHLDPYPARLTPEWREQMKAAGAVMGLDYRKFANEGQFLAEASKRLAEQQRLLGRADDTSTPNVNEATKPKYDTQALPTGGYRMRPTEETVAQRDLVRLRASIKQTAAKRGLPSDVQESLQAQLEALDKANADGTLDAATFAAAQQEVGKIMREYYTTNAFERGQTLKARTQQQVFSRDLSNPGVAPGMLKDSLGVAGTVPAQQSLVYRQFGMPGEAARIDAIEAGRQVAAADAANEQARINAAKKPEPMLPAAANAAGVSAALEQAFDPELGPETAFMSFLVSQRQLEGETRSPSSEDSLRKRFAALMLAKSPDWAWNTQFVQGMLLKMKNEITSARIPLSAVGMALSPKDYFLSSIRESFGPEFEQKASAWWDANP